MVFSDPSLDNLSDEGDVHPNVRPSLLNFEHVANRSTSPVYGR